MDADTLSNLLAYSAQVACVAALGSLLAALIRIDVAAVRYAYWRALLLLCLLLPLLQGRHDAATSSGAGTATATTSEFFGVAAASNGAAGNGGLDWALLVSAVLGLGVLARLLWVGAGLLQLKRLRHAGEAAPPSDYMEELQQLIAPAQIRYVRGVRQPVTFGFWKPIVLLPETLKDHPQPIERAVLCHELFHVQRRDWAWVLCEEVVRAALWFNPAVWWLVSRVQLAREEVVDELAVLATGRRRTYIEALMAFADDSPLAPATAFARRRHLFHRMLLISKEAVMSSRQIVLACSVMAMAVAGGSWYATAAFPLTASTLDGAQRIEIGPLEKQAQPITAENPIPRRLDAPSALYPAEAAGTGAQSSITVALTLDAFGRVAEARPTAFTLGSDGLSGYSMAHESPRVWDLDAYAKVMTSTRTPALQPRIRLVRAFATSALTAVRQWRYDPPAAAPMTFSARIDFKADGSTTEVQSVAMPAGLSRTTGVRGRGIPGGVSGGVVGGVGAGVSGGASGGVRGGREGSIEVIPEGGRVQAPIRVGGTVGPPLKTRHVNPAYPPEAQAQRIQGVVIIETTVGADGRVTDARVLRSIPMLDDAALDAVMQWEFTPTLLNGVPVPVIMTVTVNFTLQ
jgi:TonB family protein